MKRISGGMRVPFSLWSLLLPALLVLLWVLVGATGAVRPIFLPTFSETLSALGKLIVSGEFGVALLVSAARIFSATVLAAIFGLLLGIPMGLSRRADELLSPLAQPLRYLPITALVPLLILWFGIGEVMKVLFLFLGITFYFVPLVRNAIRSVPREYVDVARGFGARGWEIFRRVHWPHALPQIFDGLIVINGIGWTYVILAEIINARQGLGYLIYIAGRLQRTDQVFAGLILIAAVALTSDRFLRWLRERYLFW